MARLAEPTVEKSLGRPCGLFLDVNHRDLNLHDRVAVKGLGYDGGRGGPEMVGGALATFV
jgi:hypothetical protein